MKFKFQYDEKSAILHGDILDTFDVDATKEFFRVLKKDYTEEQRKHCILVLTDAAQGLPTKETRKVMREEGSGFLSLWGRVAVVGAKPAVRMFGRIVFSAMGKGKDSRFCETEEEALKWVKEGQEETSKTKK